MSTADPNSPRSKTLLPALPLLTLSLALPLLATSVARAQPAELEARKNVSSGATEVAAEGFKKAEAPPEESKDATDLKLAAGGLLTAGNTRTIALTSSADFRFRRSDDQLTVLAAVNVARSAPDPDSAYQATVENYQGLVRYDRFFGGGLAAFLSTTARRDRFQGLDLRLNVDPGMAYYFLDEKDLQLRAELGYDLQHDIRRQEEIDAAALDPDADPLEKTETRHSGRAFIGYNHQLSAAVGFDSSVEFIQALKRTENFRFNWGAALTSQIADRFSIATSVAVRYDNNPLPGIEKTDVFSAFNVVYTLK
jgi:putative salt-induced outer membrane protein